MMNATEFWKCTPRKLFALLEAHNKANSIDDNEEKSTSSNNQKVEPVTLEELKAWSKGR